MLPRPSLAFNVQAIVFFNSLTIHEFIHQTLLNECGYRYVSSCSTLAINSCDQLLRPHRLEPARLLCPGDFPGKNIGVGCHCLLQVTPMVLGNKQSP